MSYEELNMELQYGTALHNKIRDRLRDMSNMSRQKVSARFDKWTEAENLFLGYAKKTEEEAARESQRKNEGKNTYTSITIPYSYATLLTAHTYWASVFLGRNPVNQFTGRHGESQQQIQALEAIIDYQVQVGKALIPYFNWMLDAGKYGVGIISCYWAKDTTRIGRYVMKPKTTVFDIPIPFSEEKVYETQEVTSYEGNRLCNVRPYDWRPDPRVSLVNFQKGEFCGHVSYPSWNDILRSDEFINKDAVKALRDKTSAFERETGSGNINLPDWDATGSQYRYFNTDSTKPTTVESLDITVDLVPKDWGVGEGKKPEKWVFVLAQNEVVIKARPLGCFHDSFPYQILQYEPDAYSHQSRGMMELLKPLNETMDWLLNSHFFNVRKILNDQLVVDQSRINLKDVMDGGPGKIVRLLPSAFGQDIRTMLYQVPVQDVTRSHLADMQLIAEIIQRVTGVSDNLMGLLDPGGRKTATEVRTSSNFGINRMKTTVEYFSAVGFSPLAQMMVQNTQQYYSEEQKFKIAGDLLTQDSKFLSVAPENIQGFYDFVPVDGTLPVDRFAQANLWKEILMGATQMPFIAQAYDLGGIFQWMAQLAGLKNITQFKLPPVNVVPDEELLASAARGDMVPVGGNGQPRVIGNQTTSKAGVGAVPQY